MIYTVIGDLHLTHNNMEEIEKLFDIIEDIGNPVIMLGDTLDTKEVIRGKCLNLLMRRLSLSKLKWIFLVGNHCWFNLQCEEHSMEVFKQLPNVKIVDSAYAQDNMLFLPYYNDLGIFHNLVQNQILRPEFLFMHQGVVGFDYGNGYIADGNGHGELPKSAMEGFKRVISGHFHKYAEEGNLTFLGTPFSHSFGETDQEKVIGIFDSETGALDLLQTPFPRHRTLVVELCGNLEMDKKYIKENTASEDTWRVKLVGTEMQIKTIDQALFPKVKFLEEPTDSEQVQNAALDDTDSNEQKFVTWAKEIKQLDPETLKLGLEILGESK